MVWIILLSIIGLVAADQIIKIMIINWLQPIGTAPIIDGFIRFRYVENDGAAFSFLSATGWGRWFFIILTGACIIAGIAALLSKKLKDKYPVLNNKLIIVCLVLIVSGGIGNLIDRIFRGIVIDFIEPVFINFAVFNFADSLVTVGAFILIFYLIYDIIRDSRKGKENE